VKVKSFELRDRGTFVSAVAIQLVPDNEAERFLLRRSGFCLTDDPPMILLGGLEGGKFAYDMYDWNGNGTRMTAHEYIQKNFDTLENGAVICTEHIRGEIETPKVSERLEAPYV